MNRSELALTVNVLGPLSLHLEDRVVDVPGFRRRALLALLALAGDRGLTTARLVDSLWPDDPPDNATQALYNHISRLRSQLQPMSDRLEKREGGYRLRLEPYELDVDAVRRLGATDPQAALELWRGPALAEFDSVPGLEAESVGLDELRLQLVDDALDARLKRGETVAVEAAAAAAESPFRERTALLHIRALATDSRSAEALASARAFRSRLVEETGLDPTSALAELEQQVAAGLAAAPPRPRVARPDGPMVGRQHDREELLRLLGSHAVVTLTGPGGVGKTRLALDIAADAIEAVVVPFAVVDRPERVCQAVASTLGLRTSGEIGPDDIAAALTDRELLLVLDNCEHIAAACRDLVTAVRRVAPGVKILSTSRVTLQVSGEYVVRLQPLPVPRDLSDLDALRRSAGVRAFVEHARRRTPGYEVPADQAGDLVEVLRRLDGLPLGIELAARQVAVASLRAIHERLDRALDLSTGREGPEVHRQQTLRATIRSSYELLSADEQLLLRAIAPFAGGVDLATVEAMAESGEPLNLLHQLVDASLLVADPSTGRYRLLFTVRAFLIDEIQHLGEAELVHTRFVERCLVVAEEIHGAMFGPNEASADRRLRDELANLRSARDLGDADERVAITLAVNRVVTWRDLREIWSWADELAADYSLNEHPRRPAILAAAAEAGRLVGDFELAERLAHEAIAVAQEDPDSLGRARSVLGVVAHFRADFDKARQHWLLAGEGTVDPSAHIGSAALAALYGGDGPTARQLLDRATDMAMCGSQDAFVAYVEGELRANSEPTESVAHYLEAIAIAGSVGCNFVEGVARVSLATARARTGDVPGAADGFAYLIEFWRRTDQTTQLWTTARNAAELLAGVGQSELAALLLISADSTPGAAAVGPKIARHSGRAWTQVTEIVDEDTLLRLRSELAGVGSAAVLDRALVELKGLANESEPEGQP
ncbi:BTAD domain-containing putative transcriptional regulator [Aeromicrobium sp.]|uniref:BTAD domain-containing putative transcriptional regulator n=1 Tax=Aeromicrobium sp. TaxID=1871063 RepID=UPI002FCB718F